MLDFVINAAIGAGAEDVVVVIGHGASAVEEHLARRFPGQVRTALQAEQRGTGDAVRVAMPAVRGDVALVLCGDTPLVSAEAFRFLYEDLARSDVDASLLTTSVPDATGYGRIVRDGAGRIIRIVEHKDASPAERDIREINPAMYALRTAVLTHELAKLTPNNAQGEYYFTDVIAALATKGRLQSRAWGHSGDLVGINDRAQLAQAEAVLFERIADEHRRAGVTVQLGAQIEPRVTIAPDATIARGVSLRGATTVGAGATIDVGCVLTNVTVAAGATLLPYTVATDSVIGEAAQVGPFSHLRPASVLGKGAHVGNFVELKKTTLGDGAKANHLAYLGDGIVGAKANIGAGTIFCNYDGFKKHLTEIGEGAFIGSDSQLVAPVKVGAGAYVATGTTVTKDVPDNALAIARIPQTNKEGYATRLRTKLKG